MGYIRIIKKGLKKLSKKVANWLVELSLPKSDWKHLVDPSERRDDLAHQDTFSKIRRRLVDEYGMTWKQSTEFASKSIKLPSEERFTDVDEIIKDEGAYD